LGFGYVSFIVIRYCLSCQDEERNRRFDFAHRPEPVEGETISDAQPKPQPIDDRQTSGTYSRFVKNKIQGRNLLINTKILLVNPENPEKNVVHEAARILKGGGIVSFPTETVYALGADAYNQAMVAKIYRIKRRDRSRPLSVFLRDADDARKVVDYVSKDAEKLMKKFWPGPLTLVFKSTYPKLSLVLGKGDKLGIRVSPSKLIARILDACRVPVTATSANISGKKSCVAANRVHYFFNGRIDLILDGGRSSVFLPSTVLDVSGQRVTLLRLGHIPLEEIKKVVPKIIIPDDQAFSNCQEEIKPITLSGVLPSPLSGEGNIENTSIGGGEGEGSRV
jgi:tRNA threonylcarbamoyl adenosine modification protein (Sua5/YciO/YrdC/YwlC family)